MQVYCRGEAIIRRSGGAGEEFTVRPLDLEWDVQGVIVGPAGQRTEYAAFLEHPQLGRVSWHLWEQPDGVLAEQEANVGNHDLVQDFDYGLEHTADEQAEREAQVYSIMSWFLDRYEDPAERTSYESAEGGYLWNHGGPFDAREEIQEHFLGFPEDIVDWAVREIEADGTFEWAGGDWWDELDGGPENYEADGLLDLNEPLPDFDFFIPVEDEDEGLEEATDIDIPPQLPGLAFVISAAGLVEIAQPRSLDADEEAGIAAVRAVLVGVGAELSALLQGSNAFGTLARVVQQYHLAVSADSMSVDLVYSLGVRLENSRARLEAEIESGALPPMSLEVGEALDSLLALHGPMVLSTRRGRTLLELAHAYSQTEAETAAYREAARGLAEAARGATNLIGRDVSETLTQANADIAGGPHPARSLQVAHTVNKNLLITLAQACVPILATGLYAGLEASVPGVAFSGGVTLAADGAWNFLLVNAPILRDFVAASGAADMGWLRPLLRRVLAVGVRE